MRGAVIRYGIRRAVWLIALLFGVASATFVIFYLLPSGNAAVLRAGPHPTPELIAAIRHRLGLNEAWYVQYYDYMKALILHFDFGYSYQAHAAVRTEMFSRLPATISLTVGAAILWLITATTAGTITAAKRRSLFDRLVTGAAPLAISAPVFWLGMVSLYLFALDIGKLAILPGAGRYVPLTQDPGRWFTSLIMPWCVLAAGLAAASARQLRASLTETLSEGYVRTARANGLSERRVILRHAFRAAIAPVLSAAGLGAAFLLVGAILTEAVFNIPGIGRLIYNSIQSADLPTIQGAVLLSGWLVVIARLVVDLASAFVDPRRVRFS
jgi:peptide/nickel transport system permease protein